ncbi:hypothetical protein BDR04DRAFT_1228712 [Suillus decipiens]|nr:hypothetical protein BDR04DRAFT_1228712 [Suillus decipiens]
MRQQPTQTNQWSIPGSTQTGQWSIPGPPQHGLNPYPPIPQLSAVPSRLRPYPPEVDMFLYQQYLHAVYGAPQPVLPPYHFNGYPPASQGMGIPPCYPYAPPMVPRLDNQQLEQGPVHQTPATATEESAVRREMVDCTDNGAPAISPCYPYAPTMVPHLYNQQLEQGPVHQTPAIATEESAVRRKMVDFTDNGAPAISPCYPYAPPFSYIQELEQGPVQQTSAAAAEESAFDHGEYEVIEYDDDGSAPSPCYPYATPIVSSSYNQQPEQGPVQKTPVAAAEESTVKHGKRKAANLNDDDAAVAPPSYPSVPLTVQSSHNQQLEQGPGQQTPVVAAKESAVRSGKRKAVDLGNTSSPKKQRIHPLIHPDFDVVEYRGEARYKCRLPQCENVASVLQAGLRDHINSNQHKRGSARFLFQERDEVDSNVDESCSENQQEANEVSQGTYEGATSNEPVGFVSNSLDETIDTAWAQEVLQCFEAAAHWAPGNQLEEPVNSLDDSIDSGWVAEVLEYFKIATHSVPGEQLEEPVNSFDNTIDTVWVAEMLQDLKTAAHSAL